MTLPTADMATEAVADTAWVTVGRVDHPPRAGRPKRLDRHRRSDRQRSVGCPEQFGCLGRFGCPNLVVFDQSSEKTVLMK